MTPLKTTSLSQSTKLSQINCNNPCCTPLTPLQIQMKRSSLCCSPTCSTCRHREGEAERKYRIPEQRVWPKREWGGKGQNPPLMFQRKSPPSLSTTSITTTTTTTTLPSQAAAVHQKLQISTIKSLSYSASHLLYHNVLTSLSGPNFGSRPSKTSLRNRCRWHLLTRDTTKSSHPMLPPKDQRTV